MAKKTVNKKALSFAFCLVFLLAGCVLLFLYYSKNLSEYVPMAPGLTNLMYLPMLLYGGISAMAVSALFLILYLIQIKSNINTKLFDLIMVVVLVAFVIFNAVSVVSNYNNFNEETYFSQFDEADNMLPPENEVEKFFPYFEYMKSSTEQVPYYSFSKYMLGGTVYEIAQIECNDYENSCAFTAEYFETDKTYLSGKFVSEKSVHFSADENGEPLNQSSIRHETYGETEYDIIEQLTEKLIIVSSDEYYFLFHYQDSMGSLNLSTQEFIDTAFNQLNYLKEYSR